MHSKRKTVKIKIIVNYQCANLNSDVLFVGFDDHLAETLMFNPIQARPFYLLKVQVGL